VNDLTDRRLRLDGVEEAGPGLSHFIDTAMMIISGRVIAIKTLAIAKSPRRLTVLAALCARRDSRGY
jgi:hypothetical protein